MPRQIRTGDPRHHSEDLVKLQDRVAELERQIKCGAVVTFLGQLNLELRTELAEWMSGWKQGGANSRFEGIPVCETCDCPLVLEDELRHCRTCAKFDWLAH